MNRPGGPEEYSPGREAGATDKQSDRGPEGRKIDSHNLTPLRGWVQNGSKTPAFGRGYILSALRAYSFTPSTRLIALGLETTVCGRGYDLPPLRGSIRTWLRHDI